MTTRVKKPMEADLMPTKSAKTATPGKKKMADTKTGKLHASKHKGRK